MPVYHFLQVAKRNVLFALRGPSLSTPFKFHCFMLSKYLLKPNCSKIFMYAHDCRLINKGYKLEESC